MQGFMSYNMRTPVKKWSTCSKADFQAHYNNIGPDNWCLEKLSDDEEEEEEDNKCKFWMFWCWKIWKIFGKK